ncbi:MAG: septal ring lytic transglycosylase RlpA family protein [Desulfuromonadales bacterium]|nr:septal ring lytic transglycosylase RlpA family protein [Desulfuromonadales bacterium]NIS40051.1 septal ring lytic transglycosylase RlpA family protein [Desulfuromonadales bacterium]
MKLLFSCGLWGLFLVLLNGCGPTYTTRVIDTPQTRELKGHEKPYMVNGKRYDPLRSHEGFVQEGVASWYGKKFHGRKTSNGEIYNMHAMTAAHKTLPMGVYVKVRNRANGREAIVRVNDRGPFVKSRIIDLSYAAAKKLGVDGPGTAPVRVEALGYKKTDRGGHVTYRQPESYSVGSFSIQVGAFSVEGNARRLAAQLRSRHGFANVRKGWVDGRLFYRVRAGKYRTLEEAEAAKEQFARNGYPGGFVVASQ